MIKVLFVCLGNICRSPLAEATFNEMTKKNGLTNLVNADSAGTAAYHVGNTPDPRTIACAQAHGIPIHHHARQFEKRDIEEFDYVLAMDRQNLRHILSIGGQLEENVFLMRYFDSLGKNGDVPDPYYGGSEGFEEVYQILKRSCEGLLEFLVMKHGKSNG